MANLRHYVTIAAEPGEVFRAITEQEGLAAWWTPETVAQKNVGSILEFHFGERYHNKMQLTVLETNRRVEWLCLEGDQEWVGTRFSFQLEGKEGETVLRFAHLGWQEETDFYAHCNTTWAHYLRSLKAYCETGVGMPFGSS